MNQSETWWAKVPLKVLADPKISWRARVVYAILCGRVKRGNNTVRAGCRLLEEQLNIGRSTILRAIAELIKAGAISRSEVKRGERSCYVITSKVFAIKEKGAQRQGKRATIPAISAELQRAKAWSRAAGSGDRNEIAAILTGTD